MLCGFMSSLLPLFGDQSGSGDLYGCQVDKGWTTCPGNCAQLVNQTII